MSERQSYSPEKFKEIHWEKLALWTKNFLSTVAIATLAFAPINGYAASPIVTGQFETLPTIYYGREANDEEAASSVNVSGRGNCSGTIVSEYVIVTARHCSIDSKNTLLPPSQFSIVVTGGNENQQFTVKSVTEIGDDIIPYTFDNDKVALLLDRPLKFNDKVHAVKLGTEDMIGKYQLIAVGRGRSEESDSRINPRAGEQTYQPTQECGPPFGYSIATGPDPIRDPTAQNELEIIPVTAHGDSGLGLLAYVPPNDPDHEEGYYLVAIHSQSCGYIKYDENHLPIPDFTMGFQSLVKDDIKEELLDIVEMAPSLADKQLYLPEIKNGQSKIYLPVANK